MRTRFLAAAVCAAAAVSLAACGSSNTTNAAASSAATVTPGDNAPTDPGPAISIPPGPDDRPAPTAQDKERTTNECEQGIEDQKLQDFPATALANHDQNTDSPDWTFFENVSVDRMVLGNSVPGGPDVDQFLVSGNVEAHDAAGDQLNALFECSLPVGNEVPPTITHWTVVR